MQIQNVQNPKIPGRIIRNFKCKDGKERDVFMPLRKDNNCWNDGLPVFPRSKPLIRDGTHRPSNVLYLIRTGESIKNVFPNWTRDCFEEAPDRKDKVVYNLDDVNLPNAIPKRNINEFDKDPPLSEMGKLTARAICKQLKNDDVALHAIYTSPFLRCMETATCFSELLEEGVAGFNIEPGLTEYVNFPDVPVFFTPKEATDVNLKVNMKYEPVKGPLPKDKESPSDMFVRLKGVLNDMHRREPLTRVTAIVATPTVLQNISALLRKEKGAVDRNTALKSPPSMVQVLAFEHKKWVSRDDLIPKFSYKQGCNYKMINLKDRDN
ncbi:unnamed protein product [Bursaphelenchus okinawaensis]|uniref:Uncharacterized protein n=1 Tax=Bursaphelenchus okinawaensis TaxID=465554 RepID=A0A811JQ77_9BILA|nr:unnamed protein product [Bursaphelenchus okinawaensis]CAG9077081.1 unnamed protein product [Bursaphelenchus okinawaensis]